jgi:hypothetical protein
LKIFHFDEFRNFHSSLNISKWIRSESAELGQFSDGLRAGRLGFDSRQGQELFLFSTSFRPDLGLTQPPMQWVPGALFPGVKRQGGEAGHSLTSIYCRGQEWVGHAARVKDKKKHNIFGFDKIEGKKQLRSPRHRWVDNIKMGHKELGYEGVD